MYFRTITFTALIALAVLASGCCGPVGPGCHVAGGCSNCDDVGFGCGPIYSPLDGLRQLRKSMVCGSGCGETYFGEWRSTPPDATDPCCETDWVGGAVPCRPFCWGPWRPGALASALYGKRFCDDCGQSYLDCECGGTGYVDGGCADCGGGPVETGYAEPTPAISRHAQPAHDCPSCRQAQSARYVRSRSASRSAARPSRPDYETR